MSKQLDTLRNSLVALNAIGEIGFEGFVRVVLTELTGIPFRLAASGLQGGMDGDAALGSDAVSFEAKRYSGNIHRNEVITKIADLARNEISPDRLWVLGATIEISAQLATAVRKDGDQNAISTLILDWTAAPLPLLAVATVAAGDSAINFLVTHCDPKPDRKELVKTFKEIAGHPDYGSLLQKLRSDLSVSTLATARSIEASKAWRAVTFGSEYSARERLGQALSVNALPELLPLRASLRDQVKNNLQAGQVIVLSGGEGHGKSWLAAQIFCDHEGLALFASAELLDGVASSDLDDFLIDLLIKQTGDVPDEAVRLRWRHRLSAWQRQAPVSSLLVVVDGINQRQTLKWDRLLNVLQGRLQAIGGRLVVTVRPQFWQKTVAPGLIFKPMRVDVPEWSPDERNQLLQNYGISLDWLDESTLRTLSNPRLLGVAVASLPHKDSSSWKGLTTDRILMEHLRASQRQNFEEESFVDLTTRLSNHAKEVLERARASSKEPSQSFEADSNAVIETRFFRALSGPGNAYELRDEGLTLALGYTLIDQLWQAQRSKIDLGEQITYLIDPIYAMDRTVDVIFAALMVCALDPIRFDKAIFSALIDAFSSLQNINDQRFEEFFEIVKSQPIELFSELGKFTLERGRRLNQDWLTYSAFGIAATKEGWPLAEATVHRWLHCYNKDAVVQTNRLHRQDEDEYTKSLQRKQQKIQDTLSHLSSFESGLLETMEEVAGDTGDLHTLALRLLAGRPLAGFANSFVALGLGLALNEGAWPARKAFQQLTTFNRADREAVKESFQRAIDPLRSPDTSRAGQWTVVRMLHATGDEADATEANTIAIKLREDEFLWRQKSEDGWRHSCVADPNAITPVDIEAGMRKFSFIEPDHLMQSMGMRKEDYELQELVPVICRFEPEAAAAKARQIMLGLLTRTALPLRQLIFNATEYSPLISRDVVAQLIERITNTNMIETLPEREREALRMFLFSYMAPQLTQSEQLTCMMDPVFGSDYLLKVIPSLKPQPTEGIIEALQVALDGGDEEAVYGALAAARYGGTSFTLELEPLLLRCYESESSKIRALSFVFAIDFDLKSIRDSHIKSGWSAQAIEKRSNESWFGSMLVAEACVKNEITIEEVLKRISTEAWFVAAERIGEIMIKPLAGHFLRCLLGSIESIKGLSLPAVDLTLSITEPVPYAFISIDETNREDGRFPRQEEIGDIFGGKDDFDEKTDRLHSIFDAFSEELHGSDVKLLVERVTIKDLSLLANADSSFLSQILAALERASGTEFVWLKNFALIVANLVSNDMPQRAVALFERALASQSFVTCSIGDGLTLEHEAIWSCVPSKTINEFWSKRLIESGNDEILAREVAAAERFGAAAYIKDFVWKLAASSSMLDKAYAISVAGFSMQSDQLPDVINDQIGKKGIAGDSAKNAKKAYEENMWAKKWVADMCAAQSPEEFWRCLMISKTCIDVRASPSQIKGTNWSHYESVFNSVRKSAINEKDKNRKKTFLGQEAPDGIFVKGF